MVKQGWQVFSTEAGMVFASTNLAAMFRCALGHFVVSKAIEA